MTRPRRPSHPGRPGPPRRRSGPRHPPAADPARRAALDVLAAVRARDAYANLALPALLRERGLGNRDAALATELCYGTCRALGLLEAVLAVCVDRELSAVDGELLDALRLGTYQLLRTRIPPHAAVAATVGVVRATRGSGAAGFVNAVLRRVAEHDEAGWLARLAPPMDADPIGHLALVHPHPPWVAQAFADALGGDRDELAAALAADDARPVVHLAARPGEITAEELAAATGGEPAPYSPYGVHLAEGGDPGELAAVTEQLALVQDEGSQLTALAMVAAPVERAQSEGAGGRWLDLCAGPGGKAALLGALAGIAGGTLDAVERAEHRAGLVRRACTGLPVTVHVADARDPELQLYGYDRVLVDAPCTGLGALRRRPEARWRRRPEDVSELVALQVGLLRAGLARARPGGIVGYVVCSPHLDETIGVVAAVLADGTASQLDARPYFPGVPQLGDGPHVQLWPHRQGTDAMFCALLRRR